MEKTNEMTALLVGVDTGENRNFERSMDELAALAEASGRVVVGRIVQNLPYANKAYYIGTGKVEEVKNMASMLEANEIIFDNDLTPSQIRNLSDEIGLSIIDRTVLILDIFAMRARSREAKLQVESARLKFMLPRLIGTYDSLSRQGGAGGSMSNKGAGEKKIDLDKRRIEHRISELNRELNDIARTRVVQRQKRHSSGIPRVALVGYTNAGKSTVLNGMLRFAGNDEDKQVEAKDMLFATLETSVRRIDLEPGRPIYLSDTVGFIDELPHDLVRAFHSTLEEVAYADLIVQVVDISDEFYKEEMQVTADTLRELNASGIPMLICYNKCDKAENGSIHVVNEDKVYISAIDSAGIDTLARAILNKLYGERTRNVFLIPYDKGAVLSDIINNSDLVSTEYIEEGTLLTVMCDKRLVENHSRYIKLILQK